MQEYIQFSRSFLKLKDKTGTKIKFIKGNYKKKRGSESSLTGKHPRPNSKNIGIPKAEGRRRKNKSRKGFVLWNLVSLSLDRDRSRTLSNGGPISEVRGLWGPPQISTRSPRARGAHVPLQLLWIHRGRSQSRLRHLWQALQIQNSIKNLYFLFDILFPFWVFFLAFWNCGFYFDFAYFGWNLQCLE